MSLPTILITETAGQGNYLVVGEAKTVLEISAMACKLIDFHFRQNFR